MIDAVCRCTICAKPMSAHCRCHEPKDPVRLVCMVCAAFVIVERDEDLGDADEIETTCPECTP